MQNLGKQTKSIAVFSGVAYSLIQSDIQPKVTANEGIKRTDDPQYKTSQNQKRFSP